MYYVQLFFLFLVLTCLLFLMIGLFRPWMMLWWEDVQTRAKVIKAYGSLTVFFALVYWALKVFT